MDRMMHTMYRRAKAQRVLEAHQQHHAMHVMVWRLMECERIIRESEEPRNREDIPEWEDMPF